MNECWIYHFSPASKSVMWPGHLLSHDSLALISNGKFAGPRAWVSDRTYKRQRVEFPKTWTLNQNVCSDSVRVHVFTTCLPRVSRRLGVDCHELVRPTTYGEKKPYRLSQSLAESCRDDEECINTVLRASNIFKKKKELMDSSWIIFMKFCICLLIK